MEHCAKKISEKSTPKHVQNTFGQFRKDFGRFWNFEFLLNYLKTFQRLDPPWNTAQKKFPKKIPQNVFKTRLDGQFGNDFGRFLNFENFLIF